MSIGVICDGCDQPAERNLLSAGTAWLGQRGVRPALADPRALRRANWVEVNGSHYCPDCTTEIVRTHLYRRTA